MAEFKTLAKADAEFDSYLRGTFSQTYRALPVETLNPNSGLEVVTFAIVPLSEIKAPAFFEKWVQIFRIRNFIYVLFPLYLILTKLTLDEDLFDPVLALLASVGALFLNLGALLLTDYFDHLSGADRLHVEFGSQAIQKGWVTAESTRRWALVYLVLGALLGLPAVWVFPELLLMILLLSIFCLWAWFSPKLGLKYKRGAEFLVFLLFGPLLTIGFQIAVGAGFDLEALCIGILTGLHFVFLLHLKNFSSLLVNSQAKFSNTVSLLGFERAKKFLEMIWFLFLLLMAGYQFVFHTPEWFLGFTILPLIFSLPFLIRLRKLNASIGSQVAEVVNLGRTSALLTMVLWILQTVFYWLVIELS